MGSANTYPTAAKCRTFSWKPFFTLFVHQMASFLSFFRAHFQSLRDILSLRKRTVTWLLAMSKQAWHSQTCLQNQHPQHLASLRELPQPTYSDQVRCWKFRSGWLHRWPDNRNPQQRMLWRSHISQIGLKRVSTTALYWTQPVLFFFFSFESWSFNRRFYGLLRLAIELYP